MSNKNLDTLARELQNVTKNLFRSYQLRDRNEVTCCGVSVSQCYTIDALGEKDYLTMNELASKMGLATSTMTRVVDQLVKKELAQRHFSSEDRRVCCVSLTDKGKEVQSKLSTRFVDFQKEILKKIDPESREALLKGLKKLSEAVGEWRESCC